VSSAAGSGTVSLEETALYCPECAEREFDD
jgi:hypothetical protein